MNGDIARAWQSLVSSSIMDGDKQVDFDRSGRSSERIAIWSKRLGSPLCIGPSSEGR
jgi:hypothetical protein